MATEDDSKPELNLKSLNKLKFLLKLCAGVGKKKRSVFQEVFIFLALLLTWIANIECWLKACLEDFNSGHSIGGVLYMTHTTAKHTSFVLNRSLLQDYINDLEQLVVSSQHKATQYLNEANSKAWKLATILTWVLAVECTLGSIASLVMYSIDNNTEPNFLDKASLLGINTHPLFYWIEDNLISAVALLIIIAFYLTIFLSFEYSNALVDYLTYEMNGLKYKDGFERTSQFKSNALLYAKILRFRKKQLSMLSGLSMLEICCSSFTIGICLYSASESTMKFSSNSMMQLASVVVTALAPYFLCYIGQRMENKGSQLADECYNSGWEQWTPRERKMLSVFLTAVAKPSEFHYKLACMNMSTFDNILQAAWSYYTLLQNLAGSST